MSWPCFRQGQAMVLKGEGLHLERRWKEASIEVVQQQRGPSFMSDRCQPRLGDTLTSEIIPDRLGFTNFGQEPLYESNDTHPLKEAHHDGFHRSSAARRPFALGLGRVTQTRGGPAHRYPHPPESGPRLVQRPGG